MLSRATPKRRLMSDKDKVINHLTLSIHGFIYLAFLLLIFLR